MRVISQDEKYDIPYNLCSVCMLKAYDCYKVLAVLHTENYTIATYSTEEKAIKAMEMLREKYEYARRFETVCNGKENPPSLPSYIFHFPQDDEIEV